MNKYQEALKEITHLTFVETKYYKLLKELVDRQSTINPRMTDSGYLACDCTARVFDFDNYCSQCGHPLGLSHHD